MRVKRRIPLIALIVILAGLPVVVVSDTSASLSNANISDNEINTSQTEARNSSAGASITITMYTGDGE